MEKTYPLAQVVGHNDFPNTEKTCPNFNVKNWWKKKQFEKNN